MILQVFCLELFLFPMLMVQKRKSCYTSGRLLFRDSYPQHRYFSQLLNVKESEGEKVLESQATSNQVDRPQNAKGSFFTGILTSILPGELKGIILKKGFLIQRKKVSIFLICILETPDFGQQLLLCRQSLTLGR